MRHASGLFTDHAYRDHTEFWKLLLERSVNDFHFRQPWLSYANSRGFTSAPVPLTDELRQRIAGVGRGQELGIFVVVASAVAFTLYRYTGIDAIRIDTPPLADRVEGEFTPPVLPLLVGIDTHRTLKEHLASVRDVIAGAYNYQNFPVNDASESLLKRPVTGTNVAIQGAEAAPMDGYDLNVQVRHHPVLQVEVNGSRAFSREYLQTFAKHLANVLDAYWNPDQTLDTIDLMDAAERRQILEEYNDTHNERHAGHAPIHEIFYDRARQSGSDIAVRCDDRTLTYDELNRRSNRLARYLQKDYGLHPGDVVGITSQRSELMIIALLGVFKAGAVYLPMDSEYPEERLQFMVADAGAKALLVHSDHLPRLSALYETPMFALDIQLDALDTEDTDMPPQVTATDLAYIIYTSGSTGQPKAVLLQHDGFVNTMLHHIDAFEIQPSDRLLQFYGHSFDSSMFEMFVALLSGATLVMVRKETINDPEQLSAYIEDQGVTTLTLPPIYLNTLRRDRLDSVRRFISAGDNCRVDDAVYFARNHDYYNSYGPTETSVCVTHYRVDPTAAYGARIPIGKAIGNTSIYLLDPDLKPVPHGVPGEICIGGISLARGYLHRDDLTSEKFVDNPFSRGQRIYRTGDLGVWLPDGNLELLGRKDNQVKIRGYRIELGEVESALSQHSAVREVAVLAPEDPSGNKQLVAYVTANTTLAGGELRSFLRTHLPDFMIPSEFVVLDEMPVTANGKLDRKALPAPADCRPAEPDARAAETPVQETLVRIWKDVLGRASIGIHDNFFEIGGDSILVIQIVSRARQAGLKLAPPQLFEYQTIAELAEVVTLSHTVTSSEDKPEGPVPLSPIQEWFFHTDIADRHHFNQSVLIEVPADIDAPAAEAATRAVLEHHDALRLRFAESGGAWTAEYGEMPPDTPFRIVQDGKIVAEFDLAQGPLIYVHLIRAAESTRLLFVVHHLAIDGVSWRILLEDFHTAYSGNALPHRTASFKTWTTRLRESAQDAADELAYWLAVTADEHRTPEQADNTVASARKVTMELNEEPTRALLQEAPKAYNTEVNDLLLAALALTMSEFMGRDHILVDLEGHGREDLFDDVDISRTVGWFTSQYPVRLELAKDAGPDASIRSIKEQLRNVPRRGIGYGLLRYLSPNAAVRDRLHNQARAPILFNYLGQTSRVLAPEAGWRPIFDSDVADQSARAKRTHPLELNGIVAEGRLRLDWMYSENLHTRAEVERLAGSYIANLTRLIDHCRATEKPRFTPSDFPAAKLDQKSLDALIEKLQQ